MLPYLPTAPALLCSSIFYTALLYKLKTHQIVEAHCLCCSLMTILKISKLDIKVNYSVCVVFDPLRLENICLAFSIVNKREICYFGVCWIEIQHNMVLASNFMVHILTFSCLPVSCLPVSCPSHNPLAANPCTSCLCHITPVMYCSHCPLHEGRLTPLMSSTYHRDYTNHYQEPQVICY